MVSLDQKCHVAHHLAHLDLRNAIAPLMMLSTSHGADTKEMASYATNAYVIM